MIEGVNNSGLLLAWDFTTEGSEIITSLSFKRERPGSPLTPIATKNGNRQFNLERDNFRTEFEATEPATLKLLKAVLNSDEYNYILDITSREGNLTRTFRYNVSLQVSGKYHRSSITGRHPFVN